MGFLQKKNPKMRMQLGYSGYIEDTLEGGTINFNALQVYEDMILRRELKNGDNEKQQDLNDIFEVTKGCKRGQNHNASRRYPILTQTTVYLAIYLARMVLKPNCPPWVSNRIPNMRLTKK